MICNRTGLTVGQFLVGQGTVNQIYKDAVCGTPQSGVAMCGMWWAYACAPPEILGGHTPDVTMLDGSVTPSGGLLLGAFDPEIAVDGTFQVPIARLTLRGVAPTIRISSSVGSPQGGLVLGAHKPNYVGALLLVDLDCTHVDLSDEDCGVPVLVGAGSISVSLDSPEEF